MSARHRNFKRMVLVEEVSTWIRWDKQGQSDEDIEIVCEPKRNPVLHVAFSREHWRYGIYGLRKPLKTLAMCQRERWKGLSVMVIGFSSSVSNTKYIIFGSTTWSGQVGLYVISICCASLFPKQLLACPFRRLSYCLKLLGWTKHELIWVPIDQILSKAEGPLLPPWIGEILSTTVPPPRDYHVEYLETFLMRLKRLCEWENLTTSHAELHYIRLACPWTSFNHGSTSSLVACWTSRNLLSSRQSVCVR
jgi:hypothetical protein